MQIDFEDVPLMINGTTYGRGFDGTAEYHESDGSLSRLVIESDTRGGASFAIEWKEVHWAVGMSPVAKALWDGLEASLEERYADQLAAYRAERLSILDVEERKWRHHYEDAGR